MWLAVEVVAGLLALVCAVQFVRGKRLTVRKTGELIEIEGADGLRALVPKQLQYDIQESLRTVTREDTAVVPDIIHQEGERLRQICRRRKIEADQKVFEAITGLLEAQRGVMLAQHELKRVGKEIDRRDALHEVEMKEIEDKGDEVEMRKEDRKLDLEMKRLQLREKQRQVEQGDKERPYRFDDFGEEDNE